MGSNHSVGPYIRDCKIITNLSLVKVQLAIIRYEKTVNREFDDVLFMTRKQFQYAFELSDISTYKIFSRFDENSRGYVPSLDVWGAVVLASSAPSPEKISFLFYLMDTNHDQYLSYIDAEMLTRAATRGFSKLKCLPAVAPKTIHKVLEDIYGRDLVTLNENGEIHLRELRSFLAIDDLPRTYFANLGTVMVVEDSSKLIEQRKDLLKELAVVKAELEEVKRRIDYQVEDENLYKKERGGDVELVRLTDKVLVNSHQKGVAKEIKMIDAKSKLSKQAMISAAAEEKQRLRRQKRSERMANQDSDSDMSEEWDEKGVFSRGCKPETTLGSGGSEGSMRDAMQFKWDILRPQSEDKLVKLNLDLLLDIVEAAGLSMSDENALRCLREIPSNQLGRHNLNDVIVWVRRYMTNPPPVNPPFWRNLAYSYQKYVSDKRDEVVRIFRSILRQHDITMEIKKVEDHRAKLLQKDKEKRPVLSKRAQSLAAQKENFSSGSKMRPSQRLSVWQKRRQTQHPCKLSFIGSFGKLPKKEKTEAEKQKDKKKLTSIKRAEDETPDWKTNIRLELFSKPDSSRRPDLLKADGTLIDMDSIEPADYMEYFDSFGYKIELTEAEKVAQAAAAAAAAAGIQVKTAEDPQKNQKSGSIFWIHFRVKDSATPQEAYCLLKTATNFFESIPLDHRHDFYTTVKGQLFYLEGVKLDSSSGNDTPSKAGQTKTKKFFYPRIVCIALLHDRDPLEWMEEQISSHDLTFTRSLRKLTLDIRILQSFQEIYQKSCDMEDFQDKLFGPQEDELGEEGMNPLRFAKLCRKRQKAAQKAIEEVPKMKSDELREHLKQRGYNDRGTRAEMMNLAKVAFAKQAELIGYGELSKFGSGIVEDIFRMFDEDKDGALSTMEFNNFLVATGAQSLYDTKQYKSVMSSEQFHVDNHHRMTLEGLMSYYERYGRLARDVATLGIRSFSNQTAGQVEVRVEYEPDAVGSLSKLMERKSLAQIYYKKLLNGVASLYDVLYTGTFENFDDIFKVLRIEKVPFFKQICEGAAQPGWLAALIHKKLEFLANEQEGLIPALRWHCKEKLSGFNHFTQALKDLHDPDEGSLDSPRGDIFSSDAQSFYSMSTLSMENLTVGGTIDQSTVDEAATDTKTVKKEPPTKLTAADDLNDDRKRKNVIEMMRVFYKPVPPIDLNSEEEPERNISDDSGRASLTPEIEMWEGHLDRLLPRLIAYTHKKTKTVDEINNLLLASSDIFKKLNSGERLTRTETERMETLKHRYESRANELSHELEISVSLAASHFLAFYDAFRLYGVDVSQIGYGGNCFGMKTQGTGFDIFDLLPPGMGEIALRSGQKRDKYERSKQRKNAAINAIEREKLRRELDDEEREKRRKFEIANAQRIRDDEEKTMFGEIYSGLISAREEKMSTKETDDFLRQWEKLLNMRERRYPDTLKVAVISNDVACVKIELCPESDLRLGQAVVCLRNAAMIAYDVFKQLTDFIGEVTTGVDEAHKRIREMLDEVELSEFDDGLEEYSKRKEEHLKMLLPVPNPPTFCFESLRALVTPHYPAAFLLIFLNYFTILRKTSSTHELNDSEQQCMKEVVFLLHSSMLNAKERKNINVERKMELFTVFPLGSIEDSLHHTLQELTEHRRAHKKTVDDAALQARLQEYKGPDRPSRQNIINRGDTSMAAMEALAMVDPQQAKKLKFKQQMRDAKRKRKISIKQRNKMYEMIYDDTISAFFQQQARKADITAVKWGDEEEEKEIDDPFYVSDVSDSDSDSESKQRSISTRKSFISSSVVSNPEQKLLNDEKRSSSINEGANDTYSYVTATSSSLTTTADSASSQKKKKGIMSFLMKGRKKETD